MKMPLKLCANLSFMFKENRSLLERYEAARSAGFSAVESAFPTGYSLEQVVAAKESAGIEQVQINAFPGNGEELGFAAIAGKYEDFQQSLDLSIKYAKALNCSRIHIMSGKTLRMIQDDAMPLVYVENLKKAAQQLEKEGMIGLIEPINNFTVPGYFLNNFEKGMQYIKEVNSPHIQLQMDLFHLQILCGNLTHNIKKFLPHIGHIQIAQVPDRNEPNTPGEINYAYVFGLLEKLEYNGWIGCEYKPLASTVSGLHWIQEYGLQL